MQIGDYSWLQHDKEWHTGEATGVDNEPEKPLDIICSQKSISTEIGMKYCEQLCYLGACCWLTNISQTIDSSSRHFTPAIVPQDIKYALYVEILVWFL